MSHSYYHSLSSVKKWGGKPEDYLPIHNWLDRHKASEPSYRHRALTHHAEGIFWAEEHFGVVITNSDGRAVPVRAVAECHVLEDCGRIPTLSDWLSAIQPEGWMARPTIVGNLNR